MMIITMLGLAAGPGGLAAEAVAKGPHTLAPPSFDGHGWLVVINLAVMTAGFIVALMFAIDTSTAIWRNRGGDLRGHPVTLWRLPGLCFSAAIALRSGGNAIVLWEWDPLQPKATAWYLTLQRFMDPVAAMLGLAGLAIMYLSARGMVEHLRRRPYPIKMWASLPMLKRPAAIALLSLIAAIGVVSTR